MFSFYRLHINKQSNRIVLHKMDTLELEKCLDQRSYELLSSPAKI